MSSDQDHVEIEPSPHTAAWWGAAVVAVAAVIGALFVLRTARPSPDTLQAAQDRGAAEAQVDDDAHGRQLAVAKATQAKAANRARTTEANAQAAAASAGVQAQDAAATSSSPNP